MAKITLGIGTSHAPLLNTPAERWDERGRFDRKNTSLWYRGKSYTFAELLAARGGPEAFAEQCQLAEQQRRYQQCRSAIAQLGDITKEAAPDVLIIVSSDHKEIFDDELLPGFTVYWGDEIAHVPYTEKQLRAMPPGIAVAEVTNVPEVLTMRPGHSQLALHIIQELGKQNFDIAASKRLPAGHYENHGIPHGWGFIYQQILDGAQVPSVPVFINTFYEPNPPSAARSFAFGQALGAAITSWPEDLRVGLVASGGLTHFVVDEDQDRAFLAALSEYDSEYLGSLDADLLRAGTSELRNWIAVVGALSQTTLAANIIDYVPCYRTEAGTGCGMGFVAWR